MRLAHLDTFKEFYDYEGAGELTCPVLWTPDWIQGPNSNEGELVRPEYDAKSRAMGQPEIWHGDYAASITTVSATHTAVLRRKFPINPGPIQVKAMGMIKAHEDAGHGIRIAVDPYGGDDFQSDKVVWSDWYSTYMKDEGYEYGKWVELQVDALAISGEITVYLFTHNDYRLPLAAAHFDYVGIYETGTDGGGEVKEQLIAIRDNLSAVIAGL